MNIKGIRHENYNALWIDGVEIKPARSQRVSNHSPDGFNWGYTGSGPAQTALAILCVAADALLKEPNVVEVRGEDQYTTTLLMANPDVRLDFTYWKKTDTLADLIALRFHQDLKGQYVAKWQGDFSVEVDVVSWLKDRIVKAAEYERQGT